MSSYSHPLGVGEKGAVGLSLVAFKFPKHWLPLGDEHP